MIKTFIVAAITADGFIAQTPDQSPMQWTSKEDKQRFVRLTKGAKVIVVGSTTFKTFPSPLKDRLNIVYSHSQSFEGENVEMTSDEPAELLKKLEARGFTEVAICGGAEIYTRFMEAGVVDMVYLTIEPIFFGRGISLFNRSVNAQLELIVQMKTSQGTIMCEYLVKK